MNDTDCPTRPVRIPAQRQIVPVPGFACLELVVYGVAKAANADESHRQAYMVAKNRVPTPRALLSTAERKAVKALLQAQFPEHARI